MGRHRAHFFCRPDHPILQRAPCSWADLLQFPWATTRIPPRIVRAFPTDLGRAGRRDVTTGDLVPAIEVDVPMQLAVFATGGDTLVAGTFALLERELAERRLRPVPQALPPMAAEYGFIWPRHRSLSSAAQAFIQAVQEEEHAFALREAELSKRHLVGTATPATSVAMGKAPSRRPTRPA